MGACRVKSTHLYCLLGLFKWKDGRDDALNVNDTACYEANGARPGVSVERRGMSMRVTRARAQVYDSPVAEQELESDLASRKLHEAGTAGTSQTR